MVKPDQSGYLDIGDAKLDVSRMERIGIPEAVYGAGKTVDQCVRIVETLLEHDDGPLVVTRITPDQRAPLEQLHPSAVMGSTLTWRHATATGHSVAIFSGGVSDESVALECEATLSALGVEVRVHSDVGVAGIHRLLDVVPLVDDVAVVVAIAGMEASLATVVAGLVRQPVIGVPTSVGYGSSFEGITAMLSMMASCSPGLMVVGIDNGFGAACAATRILRQTS